MSADASTIRPIGWYDSKSGVIDFGPWKPTRKGHAPDSEWLPLYDQAALDARVAAERERSKARAVQIVEWHRNDYNRQQIDRIVAELRNGL